MPDRKAPLDRRPGRAGNRYGGQESRYHSLGRIPEECRLLDRSRGLPKRGAQGAAEHPGTLRRFVRVLQQLDLTYDIYGMSGKTIVDLLPPEFDAWRGPRPTLL